MSLAELTRNAKEVWSEIKASRKMIASSHTNQVSSQVERETYNALASRWFNDLSKLLVAYGVSSEVVEKYNNAFKSILRLTSSRNRRASYSKQFNILAAFNTDIVIFLQTDAEEPQDDDSQELGDEALAILAKIPDKDENEYLQEALGCWKAGYLKGATVLLWCAAIDRIHRVIEQDGFENFNRTSVQMKAQTAGRFKRFSKAYSIQSLSELRTVFDSDILWILEGMQLIDTNERTRLASCFDMRCHSGHPGAAPITKYNVLSCFSDVVEIVLANPKFSIQKSSN